MCVAHLNGIYNILLKLSGIYVWLNMGDYIIYIFAKYIKTTLSRWDQMWEFLGRSDLIDTH